ncbi:MAG TPA: hypothetical protein VNX29_16080 [Kaistia sp.]|nr:hypothetical protein [Kaistia sp.]
MMNRRQIVAGAVVVPFALPAAMTAAALSPAPSADPAVTDPDLWVRLCAERRMLCEHAGNSFVGGELPDEIADFCWGRVNEIDAEIASSQPTTARGLRAAMTEYLRELDGCAISDQHLLKSLFRATVAFVDDVSA